MKMITPKMSFLLMPFIGVTMAVAPVAAETCLADWGRAGEIVRSEKLVTVEELTREVLPGGEGQILKSTLCRRDADYIYRLVVRDKAGQLRNTVVPARRR